MGVIKSFKSKTIYLDTAPFIYLIEEHPLYHVVISKIFEAHARGEFLFITSVLTLSEVFAQPYFKRKPGISEKYEFILTETDNLLLLDFQLKEAKKAAELKSKYKLAMPDAIHLATAIENKADFFLTNDKALTKINSLEIILLSNV